jgi:hypothetical protein
VFIFKEDEEEELELPFTDDELKEKFDGKLEKEMKGPTYEVLSKLLKVCSTGVEGCFSLKKRMNCFFISWRKKSSKTLNRIKFDLMAPKSRLV